MKRNFLASEHLIAIQLERAKHSLNHLIGDIQQNVVVYQQQMAQGQCSISIRLHDLLST